MSAKPSYGKYGRSVTHPSAHQRCSLLKRYRIRQFDCVICIRNHVLSQPSIILKSGQRGILAKPKVITTLFFQRPLTLWTRSASVPEQQSSDAIANFPTVNVGSQGDNCAHGLVAGGDRSFGLVDPFIDLVVCVAVARSPDFEEEVVWAWRWSVDLVKLVGCVVLRQPSDLVNG
jgi:hypothetical protein